jgi:hypothetical protein
MTEDAAEADEVGDEVERSVLVREATEVPTAGDGISGAAVDAGDGVPMAGADAGGAVVAAGEWLRLAGVARLADMTISFNVGMK